MFFPLKTHLLYVKLMEKPEKRQGYCVGERRDKRAYRSSYVEMFWVRLILMSEMPYLYCYLKTVRGTRSLPSSYWVPGMVGGTGTDNGSSWSLEIGNRMDVGNGEGRRATTHKQTNKWLKIMISTPIQVLGVIGGDRCLRKVRVFLMRRH